MKSDFGETVNCRRICIARRPQLFSEIMERMYYSQKIDGAFYALGKAVGDDYNVSDRALGTIYLYHFYFIFFNFISCDLLFYRCLK